MTLWTIVETMAGHDINHLQLIERRLARSRRAPERLPQSLVHIANQIPQIAPSIQQCHHRIPHSRRRFIPASMALSHFVHSPSSSACVSTIFASKLVLAGKQIAAQLRVILTHLLGGTHLLKLHVQFERPPRASPVERFASSRYPKPALHPVAAFDCSSNSTPSSFSRYSVRAIGSFNVRYASFNSELAASAASCSAVDFAAKRSGCSLRLSA